MASEEEIVLRNVREQLQWSCLDCTEGDVVCYIIYILMLFASKCSNTADETICGFLQQDDRKLLPVVRAKHGIPRAYRGGGGCTEHLDNGLFLTCRTPI